MQKQRVTDKTHVAQKDSPKVVESSIVEEVSEFLDEVDQLLENQEVLVGYKQRGGE